MRKGTLAWGIRELLEYVLEEAEHQPERFLASHPELLEAFKRWSGLEEHVRSRVGPMIRQCAAGLRDALKKRNAPAAAYWSRQLAQQESYLLHLWQSDQPGGTSDAMTQIILQRIRRQRGGKAAGKKRTGKTKLPLAIMFEAWKRNEALGKRARTVAIDAATDLELQGKNVSPRTLERAAKRHGWRRGQMA